MSNANGSCCCPGEIRLPLLLLLHFSTSRLSILEPQCRPSKRRGAAGDRVTPAGNPLHPGGGSALAGGGAGDHGATGTQAGSQPKTLWQWGAAELSRELEGAEMA
jgi:hypothetical protein